MIPAVNSNVVVQADNLKEQELFLQAKSILACDSSVSPSSFVQSVFVAFSLVLQICLQICNSEICGNENPGGANQIFCVCMYKYVFINVYTHAHT